MTPINRWTRLAPLVCLLMTSSCAAPRPISVLQTQLSLPEAALRPCRLNRLGDRPTLADLEVAYVERGARFLACDGARRLAVEGWLAERELAAKRQNLPGARQKLPLRPSL